MKTISIVLCILFAATTGFSQTTIKSQTVLGGINNDDLKKIEIGKGGIFLFAANSNSNIAVTKSEDSRGGYDFWIIKMAYDTASGKVKKLWDKTIGGNKDDLIKDAKYTKDGGIILAGSSASDISGEKTDTNYGGTDCWLVKLNANGTVQWDKTYGTSNFSIETFESVEQTNDGGYILAGTLGIIKTDSNGNTIWQKSPAPNENYRQVKEVKNGYYIATTDIKAYPIGFSAYSLEKINYNGNLLWKKTFTGDDIGTVTNYTIPVRDGFMIYQIHALPEYVDDSSPYWIWKDYSRVVLKTDTMGNILWRKTRTFPGEPLETSLTSNLAVTQTNDGGSLITYGKHDYASLTSMDFFVEKLNASGDVEWDDAIIGSSGDYPYDIKKIDAKHYLIGGFSFSGIGYDKTKPNIGGDDVWVVAITDTNTVVHSSKSSESSQIKTGEFKPMHIYPNPAKDILRIQSTTKATYTLTNQSGKLVLTKIINGNGEINVSHLPAGLYYLKNNETGFVQKVIITK